MAQSYQELARVYEDRDGLLRADLDAMKGANMFSSFYETLKNVSEYNHKFPDVGIGSEVDIERVAHVSRHDADIVRCGGDAYLYLYWKYIHCCVVVSFDRFLFNFQEKKCLGNIWT
jgi:uncharacterized protein related to proFAR isomerase